MFNKEVSDDEMPKESRNSMKQPVKTALINATNVAMLKEKNPSRLDITSEESNGCESNGNDLSKNKMAVL